MILVDIGNSGLRATHVLDSHLFAGERVFRLSWDAAGATQRKSTPQQLAAPDQRWCDLQDHNAFEWLVSNFGHASKDRWIISCVQRTALSHLNRCLEGRNLLGQVKLIRYVDLPFTTYVDEPQKTGIDRLLAAWGSKQYLSGKSVACPIIVVQAGTAVTVDWIDEQGAYCGGAIMPGLGLSLQLLAAGTDQLPWLGNHLVDTLPELPGKNTVHAISAGVNAALVGGTKHLIDRYRQSSQLGEKTPVVVTGGDGKLLLPHIEKPVWFFDHLVLFGLSLLGREQ
ncbi:MAG: type III pantothenate kinase [Pirellula sp.]